MRSVHPAEAWKILNKRKNGGRKISLQVIPGDLLLARRGVTDSKLSSVRASRPPRRTSPASIEIVAGSVVLSRGLAIFFDSPIPASYHFPMVVIL